MKQLIISALIACCALVANAGSWIRVNQVGYLPSSSKVAVFISDDKGTENASFSVVNAANGATVLSGSGLRGNADRWGMKRAYRLYFSQITAPGSYYITCEGAKSPTFKIDGGVYDGMADFVLKYMRQQRCGDNPYLDTLCHQHDGYIVDLPGREGEKIDVRGGWHDASDCLQYLTTSATATFQMMFAWQQHPDKRIFKDHYLANGRPGENGIPDILDEARWGIDWMLRMNPDSTLMFNQIADDRDHKGMRLPSQDIADYGYGPGLGRPVFPVTGKPQGLRKYKNRSTGVSSSAAKYASVFALGAEIFKDIDPALSGRMQEKAAPDYRYGQRYPGNNQTACTVSPYFYEEDNWVDDMELAAAAAYDVTGSAGWLKDADYWGELEDVSPWMELGRARHYQYYPFINLGHYYLAKSGNEAISRKYCDYMRRGLECLWRRARTDSDPFFHGVPFMWCSNNFVSAAVTQAMLYRQLTGDTRFSEMEASLCDWLFGCNPWGTAMICGLPGVEDSPTRVHSFVTILNHEIPYGGLVDGPIARERYEGLLGVHLNYPDEYAPFQQGAAVYHDDPGDYSSDEPTMDGTASLTYMLSALESEGHKGMVTDNRNQVVRFDGRGKKLYLIFSADSAFEGAPVILKTLKRHHAKGSFFFTGNCMRMPEHQAVLKSIIKQGHMVSGHSDRHLLYANWDGTPLVSRDSLVRDLHANLACLARLGVDTARIKYFLPPYEHCTAQNVRDIASQGLTVVNLTPGVTTNADYTTPDMKNYRPSQQLIDALFKREAEQGLDGSIILIHPGTQPARTDKLYNRLDEIMTRLERLGYSFEPLELKPVP